MKRVTKLLAALLVLVLVIGSIPVSAASTPSLKKSSKILYLGGCKGTKANGTKANFSESVKASKLLKGFKSKTMDIKLESDNEKVAKVSNSNGTITAVGRGTAKVMITVRNKSTEKTIFAKAVKITVKKNADADFSITGIKDGDEFEVGKSVTVVLTRKSDDDYRKLTVDKSGVSLTKKNDVGSKYTVKFNEAGTYTFTAITYQSSTYAGATAKKTFTVTVKGAAPTPTEVPTSTPTPTEKPANLSIKQTSLDKFVISGVSNASGLKAKDIKIYKLVAGTKVNTGSVSEVTADGTNLSVKMLSNLEANVEYYVEYTGLTGNALSFKAASYDKADIYEIVVTKTRVLYGQDVDLGVRYLNKDGVDITDGVSSAAPYTLKMVEGGIGDAYPNGKKVHFLKPDKVCIFEISVMTGFNAGSPNYITQNVAVSSYEPQLLEFIYTVTSDDGIYMKKDDPQNNSFALGTENPVIEGYFVYVDEDGNKTYKTLNEEKITKITLQDPTIILDGTKTSAGGWGLKPIKTGSTTVLFFKGDKGDQFAAEALVTVLDRSTANTLNVTLSKQMLNINSIANDSITINASVVDQYGNPIKDGVISIKQTDDTKYSTGTVAFGTFVDGKLKIQGTNVILNSGVTEGTITAVVSCGSATKTIYFEVGNYAEANSYIFNSVPNAQGIILDATVKPGSALPSEARFSVDGTNNGFLVKKEIIKFYPGKQPDAQVKASDLGVSVGTQTYIFTIQKDGSYLSALPTPVITNTSTELVFKSFDHQIKIEEGTYVIAFYSVIAGTENSDINLIGTNVIEVPKSSISVQYNQVKETTSYTNGVDVAKDCFEFYIDGKKLDSTAIKDAVVIVGGNGDKYVQSVKLSYNNDVYGEYSINVSIDAGIIK